MRPSRERGFWLLWTATAAGNVSDGIRLTALPLLVAGWTRDPRLIAGLEAAMLAPWLLFGLPAGALADRADRRRLLWAADLTRLGLYAVLVAAILTGLASVPLAYAVALGLGAAEALRDNAAQALLPAILPDGQLERGNSRLVAAEVGGEELAGPAAGGLLFAAAPALPFLVNGALLTAAAAGELALPAPPRAGPDRPRRPLHREVADGLRWLLSDRLLRVLAAGAALLTMLTVAWESLLVLYVLERLGGGGRAYGLVWTVGAAGGLLGGLAAPRVAGWLGRPRALLAAFTACAGAQLTLGLTASLPLTAAMMALTSFAFALWNVLAASLRQRLTPGGLLGRVTSVWRTAAVGCAAPLGALLGGTLAGAYGLHAPFFAGGPLLLAAGAAVAAAAARDPRLRAAAPPVAGGRR